MTVLKGALKLVDGAAELAIEGGKEGGQNIFWRKQENGNNLHTSVLKNVPNRIHK
jgi:hypothetical protein